eukprot:3345781-Prymnesium_polylepis.1
MPMKKRREAERRVPTTAPTWLVESRCCSTARARERRGRYALSNKNMPWIWCAHGSGAPSGGSTGRAGRRRAPPAGGTARGRRVAHLLKVRAGRHREQRHQRHDARVAEGEEEADEKARLLVAQELACDVVDGGDVVGVDGVAQTEAVCEDARTKDPREAHARQQQCAEGHAVRDDERQDDAQAATAQRRLLSADEQRLVQR